MLAECTAALLGDLGLGETVFASVAYAAQRHGSKKLDGFVVTSRRAQQRTSCLEQDLSSNISVEHAIHWLRLGKG